MRARREQVVMGAVAAAVLVAIVALTAAGGGVKHVTPTPTPAPPPERGDRPLFGGSLEPGVRYRTRAFVPALSFAVGDSEWIVDDATQPDRLLLIRRIRSGAPGGERDPRSYLSFSRSPVPAGRLRAALRTNRGLLVGRPRPTLVAGVRAQRFSVALRFRDPATACRTLRLVCMMIPSGRYLTAGTRMRRTVLTTASGPLVIDLIGDTQRDLERIEAPAAGVLLTLRIGVR